MSRSHFCVYLSELFIAAVLRCRRDVIRAGINYICRRMCDDCALFVDNIRKARFTDGYIRNKWAEEVSVAYSVNGACEFSVLHYGDDERNCCSIGNSIHRNLAENRLTFMHTAFEIYLARNADTYACYAVGIGHSDCGEACSFRNSFALCGYPLVGRLTVLEKRWSCSLRESRHLSGKRLLYRFCGSLSFGTHWDVQRIFYRIISKNSADSAEKNGCCDRYDDRIQEYFWLYAFHDGFSCSVKRSLPLSQKIFHLLF